MAPINFFGAEMSFGGMVLYSTLLMVALVAVTLLERDVIFYVGSLIFAFIIANSLELTLPYYIIGFFLVGFSVAFLRFLVSLDSLLKRRLITMTPTSNIASAPQGLAEIKGRICKEKTHELIAPLSKKPCYWYRFQVEKRVTTFHDQGRKSYSWKKINQGQTYSSFYLKDATGSCLVLLGKEELLRVPKKIWQSFNYDNPHSRSIDDTQGKFRFTEEFIYDDLLYALGYFQTKRVEGDRVHFLSQPKNSKHRMIIGRGTERGVLAHFDKGSSTHLVLATAFFIGLAVSSLVVLYKPLLNIS